MCLPIEVVKNFDVEEPGTVVLQRKHNSKARYTTAINIDVTVGAELVSREADKSVIFEVAWFS